VEEYNFNSKNILVVEDNKLNLEIAVAILNKLGCNTYTAENGLKAIEEFSLLPVGHLDAILMDVRMPIMDGIMATYKIRNMSKKDSKTVPIIAMTADSFEDDIRSAKKVGMNAYLTKPIDSHVLGTVLQNLENMEK
jgi:CheY-like chemotaxis protein